MARCGMANFLKHGERRKLIEAQSGSDAKPLTPAREVFDYPLIVAS